MRLSRSFTPGWRNGVTSPDSRVSLRRNEPPADSLPNPTLNSLCSLRWKSPRNSRIAFVSPSQLHPPTTRSCQKSRPLGGSLRVRGSGLSDDRGTAGSSGFPARAECWRGWFWGSVERGVFRLRLRVRARARGRWAVSLQVAGLTRSREDAKGKVQGQWSVLGGQWQWATDRGSPNARPPV
jgi:hypothetical protein